MNDDNMIDIDELDFNVELSECFAQLKPHPKFANCTFETYQNNPDYPSQLALKQLLQRLTISQMELARNWYFTLFSGGNKNKLHQNIYIDGTYGIGKTHLLSATYNAFNGTKAFLSFIELTYFINYYGLEQTIEEFRKIELLLLDEFDLDDPATTRMMARFIEELDNHTTIITTSNRLPAELGGSKFDTDAFARELGIIANSFKTIVVEGESFRIKLAKWQANFSKKKFAKVFHDSDNIKSLVDYKRLNNLLQNNHPFKFFIICKNIKELFIEDFHGFTQLNDALRFAVFIDHCYYYNTKIFFENMIEMEKIFPPELMKTSFERQFLRCISRLDELAVFFK